MHTPDQLTDKKYICSFNFTMNEGDRRTRFDSRTVEAKDYDSVWIKVHELMKEEGKSITQEFSCAPAS